MTKANGPNRAPWLALVGAVVVVVMVWGLVSRRGRDDSPTSTSTTVNHTRRYRDFKCR